MKTGTNTNKKYCINKDNGPLYRKCLVEYIIYEATVSATNQTNTYSVSAERDFKSRYNNYALSFRSKEYIHHNELSKSIWPLQKSNTQFSLEWRTKSKAMPYKYGSRKCDLCLAEKLPIARFEGVGLLNKQTGLSNKCRNRNKFIIGNIR